MDSIADHLLEDRVLGDEVLLELHDLVEDRIGIVVGGLGPLVGGRGEHVLADDDHRQEDQLQEGLRDPRDEHHWAVGTHRRGEADEGECSEGVRAPHGADAIGYLHGEPGVEPGRHTIVWQLIDHLDRPGAVLELLLGPVMGDVVVDGSRGHQRPPKWNRYSCETYHLSR